MNPRDLPSRGRLGRYGTVGIDSLLFYPKFVIPTLLSVRCVSTIPQKSDQVKPTGMELNFLLLLSSDLHSENQDPSQCFYNVQCFGSGFIESGFVSSNRYLDPEMLKKKCLGQFSKNYRTFTQKIVTKLSKIWVWDPRFGIRDPESGKNLFRILNPGSRCQLGTGSRIRIRNTGYCNQIVWASVILDATVCSHVQATLTYHCPTFCTRGELICPRSRPSSSTTLSSAGQQEGGRGEGVREGGVANPDPHGSGFVIRFSESESLS